MAALRGTSRTQVGSSAWISEQRAAALQIAEAETEEFTFSARNELDWLNEHMAEIFNENQINVAEIFKTPGKLRGKTPRTARKRNPLEARVPLSDVFSATPRALPSPLRQQHLERHTPAFQVAEDPVETAIEVNAPRQTIFARAPVEHFDSGYHGSQVSVATGVNERWQVSTEDKASQDKAPATIKLDVMDLDSEERRTTEGSFQSAKEEQTLPVNLEESTVQQEKAPAHLKLAPAPIMTSRLVPRKELPNSPTEESAQKPLHMPQQQVEYQEPVVNPTKNEVFDDVQSPSDGSSPIRPVVRKSSLNFASLPAREPLTTKKSIGNRNSRTSHLEQSRTSYYGKNAGGKSLGGMRRDEDDDLDDLDVFVIDAGLPLEESNSDSKLARLHNKTSTQRLQDQISMLGQSQSQASRPSKSIPSLVTVVPHTTNATVPQDNQKAASPFRVVDAPGAFPEDEDSWIGPPTTSAAVSAPSIFSPRPVMHAKSHSTDVMDSIHGKENISGADFNVPKQRRDEPRHRSPLREPAIPDRTTSTLGHTKSASTSIIKSPRKGDDALEQMKKGISVSNPILATMHEDIDRPTTPKSPSRSYRESPLKAAKDKLSSILKTSKNLFASSAAASAAAKTSTISPPPYRIRLHDASSMEDILYRQPSQNQLYPSLDDHSCSNEQPHQQSPPNSPRKTKALLEREEKRREKEAKEAREAHKLEQKLEKVREKENDKARQFSQQERERVAAMERQIIANKEQERLAKAAQAEITRATRSSPRKAKAQLEAEGIVAAVAPQLENVMNDAEMADAVSSMAPPALPRLGSHIGKARDALKRPVKPAEKPGPIPKQAPVVIRVDTGSQRGPRAPYHPSNASLASSLGQSLSQPPAGTSGRPGPQSNQKPKPVTSTIRPKASTSSLKSVSSSTGKVKALEMAAKKREEAEQEAQRKRQAKLESDRKRAALQESKQADQQRREDTQRQTERAERQREKEHVENHANASKTAQRAALEKKMEMELAKQLRPPPPAPRPQTTEAGHTSLQDKPLPAAPSQRGEAGPPRPLSRLNSMRPQEDFSRPMNQPLQNTTKAPPKRPLPHDAEESQSRLILQRNPLSYQQTESKRRRTSDNQDEEMEDLPPRGAMAPPVRQSGIKKDANRGLFTNGYANVPQPSHAVNSLHKSALTSQHIHQNKPAHPMDMAQHSKATITFAPNPSQVGNTAHKTPARAAPAAPGVKSTVKISARTSPRYQNGDSIDLPEIETDSEDDDNDDDGKSKFPVPGWANSPALRAGIMRQETIDPATVFGLPGEIKLEEVFKNKERHQRFRQRTSSANWTGSDRLTEEEVARDLVARERLRREGGWSYGLS